MLVQLAESAVAHDRGCGKESEHAQHGFAALKPERAGNLKGLGPPWSATAGGPSTLRTQCQRGGASSARRSPRGGIGPEGGGRHMPWSWGTVCGRAAGGTPTHSTWFRPCGDTQSAIRGQCGTHDNNPLTTSTYELASRLKTMAWTPQGRPAHCVSGRTVVGHGTESGNSEAIQSTAAKAPWQRQGAGAGDRRSPCNKVQPQNTPTNYCT